MKTGQFFVSYKRSPGRPVGDSEGELLRRVLNEHGLQTWRDIEDLPSEPTEHEIRRVLNDPDTCGAIFLLSPEVASSPVIRTVEAPLAMARHDEGNGFIFFPVLLEVGYAQASDILGLSPTVDLSQWNLTKTKGAQLTRDDASFVAQAILKTKFKDRSGPIEMAAYSTRQAPNVQKDLVFDFFDHFENRLTKPGAFNAIDKGLRSAAKAMLKAQESPKIVSRGQVSLPLAALIGSTFSPLAGFELSWMQFVSEGKLDRWSFAIKGANLGIDQAVEIGDETSIDLVLQISITKPVNEAVKAYVAQSKWNPRATLSISPDNGWREGGTSALTAQEGMSLVQKTLEALTATRSDLGMTKVRLHIFAAVPLAFMVMLSQRLNTINECVVYDSPQNQGEYVEAFRFDPSRVLN